MWMRSLSRRGRASSSRPSVPIRGRTRAGREPPTRERPPRAVRRCRVPPVVWPRRRRGGLGRERRGARGPGGASWPLRCSRPGEHDAPSAFARDGERCLAGRGGARRSWPVRRGSGRDGQRHGTGRRNHRQRIGGVEQAAAERVRRAGGPIKGPRALWARLEVCGRRAGKAQSTAWAMGVIHHDPFA
jgi:hypothetical protein